MSTPTFVLTPLTASDAADLRAMGGDVYVADNKPGYPCRQCLRDAEIGEEVVLLSFDPFGSTSPYRSASPIFLHLHDCGSPSPGSEVPTYLSVRQLSVRSFDADEMMIDATVIDGDDLRATIDAMFADDLSQMLHVHNAQRGCYAVRVDRV